MSASHGPYEEDELKMRVSDATALDAVEGASGGAAQSVVVQVNYFFDTADLDLNQAKYIVRLRDEGGRFFVTAKAPEKKALGGVLTKRREAEAEIDAALAAGIKSGQVSPLLQLQAGDDWCRELVEQIQEMVGAKPIQLVGQFENERRRRATKLEARGQTLDLVLELDTTTFPNGTVDYEVEVEIPKGLDVDLVKEAVDDLFARAQVRPSAASSKSARFFGALKEVDRGSL